MSNAHQQYLQQQAADFKAVAESAAGRRFLRRLVAECGVLHVSFTGDALSGAFKQGRQSIGVWVHGQFVACPELYVEFLRDGLRDAQPD